MNGANSVSLLKINNELNEHDSETRDLTPLKLLVLDDDAIFEKVMVRTDSLYDVEINFCQSLEHFKCLIRNFDYHVVILDHNLQGFTWPEVAAIVGSIPIIVVSAEENPSGETKEWPRCVKKIVPKKVGVRPLIEEAITVSKQCSKKATETTR